MQWKNSPVATLLPTRLSRLLHLSQSNHVPSIHRQWPVSANSVLSTSLSGIVFYHTTKDQFNFCAIELEMCFTFILFIYLHCFFIHSPLKGPERDEQESGTKGWVYRRVPSQLHGKSCDCLNIWFENLWRTLELFVTLIDEEASQVCRLWDI